MTDTESELRQQLTAALEGADYPVSDQMDLVPALPNGPGTRFEAGETTFTAMEMAARIGKHQDFPYNDVESLVEDVIAGLKAEGMLATSD
ncbi:MAG: MTH865 family protein [Haloferacaceae archaeon]